MVSFPSGRMFHSLICLALLYLGAAAQPLEMPEVTAEADNNNSSEQAGNARGIQDPDSSENRKKPAHPKQTGSESSHEEFRRGQADDLAEPAERPPIEKMPELRGFVDAEYPESVYSQGIQGAVLMTLLVSDSGIVDSLWIDRGIHPLLDSNAVSAARQFTFEPAIAGGEPVPVYLQYEYRFSLDEIAQQIEPVVNFSGKLIERGTRAPVPDALVVITFLDTTAKNSAGLPFSTYRKRIGDFQGQYVEEDRLVTMSDSAGRFSFYSLPSSRIVISVPATGYTMFADTMSIDESVKLDLEFYLQRGIYSDYEIVVYGKTKKKEISRRKLTLNEVKKIPGLGGDAVKVVQAFPGVNRPRMAGGAIVVRGAPSWDTNFYLDGMTLPALYHFGGLKSVYNSDALKGVSFYPGGFGVRFGGGIAGVVELNGRTPKTDRWHGMADISTIDASFLLEGPLTDKLSLIGSARRSYIGNFINVLMENSEYDFPFSVSPFYWDYLLRSDYSVNEDLNLFGTFLGSRDSMNLHYPDMPGGSKEIDEATDRFQMGLMFHMAMVGADWKITDIFFNSFRYAYNYSDARFSVFGQVKTENVSHDHHLRNQIDIALGEHFSVSTGVDLYCLLLDLNLALQQGDGLIRRDSVRNWLFGTLGGYSFIEWEPIEKLDVIAGLRYDVFPELRYRGSLLPEFWDYKDIDNTTAFSGEPSVRMSMRYALNKNHTLKGAIGNYSQTPQPVGQVIMEGWGDPFLPATKAAHYVLGYEWQISDLIGADVQGYINRQWNIPRIADAQDLDFRGISGIQDLWLDDGRGRMMGIELMLRHDQGERFFGWLAYTLSRSERFNHHSGEYELYSEDETHHLQVVGSWRMPKLWESGVRLRYVTGKPTTPIIGATEDETFNQFRPIYGETNSERMNPFFQIDIRIDKKFVFDKWILSTYLDIQNISWFLYKSPEFIVYDDYYDEKTTISNIIMPGIGMRAEF